MRILIVDDETFVIDVLRFHLEARGHAVRGVTSHADVEAVARDFVPDGAILDYLMPGGGGVVALSALQEALGKKVRFVFYTKYADSDLECEKLLEAGVPQERIVLKLDARGDLPLLLEQLGGS